MNPSKGASKAGMLYVQPGVIYTGALVIHMAYLVSQWHRAPTSLRPFSNSRTSRVCGTQRVVGEPRRTPI
jgi:hypothetical protein